MRNSARFSLVGPNRRGRDLIGGAASGVFASRAGQAADGSDAHVVVAQDLAGEAQAGGGDQAPGGEDFFFGLSHGLGFAGEELDSAGGAACVAAAGVELVDAGFVGEGVDQALVLGDFELAGVFDCELGHWGEFPPGPR